MTTEQKHQTTGSDQDGGVTQQNAAPVPPPINDPWGIAGVVASVMGDTNPSSHSGEQQPSSEQVDGQDSDPTNGWVDLEEQNIPPAPEMNNSIVPVVEDVPVTHDDHEESSDTQADKNVETANTKSPKKKRGWFSFGRSNIKSSVTEQPTTPVEPTISGDIESILQPQRHVVEQDADIEQTPQGTASQESEEVPPSSSPVANDRDDDEVIVVTQTSKLTMIATAISLVLGMAGIGIGTLSLSKTNSTSFTLQMVELRTDMVARMDKLEGEIMSNKQADQSAGNAYNLSLQKLEADIASMGTQLNDLKAVTEKISADTELSITWSRQTRTAADDLAKTVDSINTAVSSASTEIARLKSSLATVSAQRQQAARAQVKAKRKQTPVTSIEGFKLFSVDDWGGVMLITMTKDDVVNRLQIGDFLEGWRVDTADIANKRVVFVKGDIRTIVIANGG